MLFNSYEFLIIFLPLFLLAYFSTSRHKTLVLTIGSYIFYMGWKPSGAILLLMCTSINYLLGKAIFNSSSSGFRKILCAVSVAADLSILSYFKYLGFFEGAINSIQGHQIIKPAEIALPIGISFFIFQCISYTVDIYRKRVNPTKNFLDFACYVSLFPHLVAGPILRYSLIESQLRNREHTANKFAEGVAFFIVGLSKKVLIADTLATAANQLFDGGALGAYSCWAGLIAYTLQIFYDFAGYSDMAVGLGRMLGFYIPQNFNSPYLSTSISDFWRRWHMTL
ncbi:MAG: MBOAT family O-acyltransferase, partial [bacterium]